MSELLPFETLPTEENPTFYVPPQVWRSLPLASQKKLSKIYDLETNTLRFPRKFGLLVGERLAIKNTLAGQREISQEVARIVVAIADESGKSIQEIAELIDSPEDNLPLFQNHLDKLIAIQQRQNSISLEEVTVTTVMQYRVAKDWSTEDTMELPEQIFDWLDRSITKEQGGWEDPVDSGMGKQVEPKSLNGASDSSSPNRTGEKSTKKSEAVAS